MFDPFWTCEIAEVGGKVPQKVCVCVIVCVFSVSDSIKVVKKVLFQHVST